MKVVLTSENIKRALDIYLSQQDLDSPIPDLGNFDLLVNSSLGLVDPYESGNSDFIEHLTAMPEELLDEILLLILAIKQERLWRALVQGQVKLIELQNSNGLMVIDMETKHEHNSRTIANFIKRFV